MGVIYGGLTGKSKADFENGNALYVTYKSIFNSSAVDLNSLGKVTIGANERQNKIQYGDILFTGSSESLDEVAMSSVVMELVEDSIYLNSFSFGFRFNPNVPILPGFTKHLFRGVSMRKEIIKTASGVTRFNVSKERFRSLVIPVPPLEEQRRIVEILDQFDTLTQSITEGLPREIELRRKQYEYYREQLLSFN